MAIFSASKNLETGVIEMTFSISQPALERLMKQVFLTNDQRDEAEFGDKVMREVVEVVDWLRDRARDDEET